MTLRPVHYLVSAAGVPNFGDEFIARAWLDWLARHRPHADVWLDCVEPGRASHLFADTHPRLRTTNTLWQLAHVDALPDAIANAERAAALVNTLGTPRVDLGLEMLRSVSSVHMLGGGYTNSLWSENLAILGAVSELGRSHGVRLYATGQGFLPLDDDHRRWVSARLAEFAYAESRDAEGAAALRIPHGPDDAMLAFADRRAIYVGEGSPDVMVLVQGDFVEAEREESTLDAIAAFVDTYAADGRFGIVEALPPTDARFAGPLRERYPDAEFFPFMRLWQEGLPMRRGQKWLTSRYHFHLLAAAAGAEGAVIDVRGGYYSVKHDLLLEAGTGWSLASGWERGVVPAPSRARGFQREVSRQRRRKTDTARSLYR